MPRCLTCTVLCTRPPVLVSLRPGGAPGGGAANAPAKAFTPPKSAITLQKEVRNFSPILYVTILFLGWQIRGCSSMLQTLELRSWRLNLRKLVLSVEARRQNLHVNVSSERGSLC